MTQRDNAGSKWGEKKVEGEDSVRTVDCLRVRLLAERLASRNAKEEAEQLGNKLIELENQLKQEAKSRNRAEKRLKLLFKKLQSMNISYVSDESGCSGLVDKSDISSLSSTTSSSTKESKSQKGSENLHQKNESQNCLLSVSDDNSSANEGSSSSTIDANLPEIKGQDCEIGQNEDPRSQEVSVNLEQNIAQKSIVENFLFSEGDANSEKSSHLGSNSKMDDHSDICYNSFRFPTEDEGLNKEDDQVDNSMALVAVDMPRENQTIDPEGLDSTVREVLDDLRHAKEKLQSSIERRRTNMIRVG